MKRRLPASLRKITYKDFDLSFRRHPVTGKLLIKKEDEAVKQAVKNLILTDRFERPFRANYGGHVRARMFDPFSAILAADYHRMIVNTIRTFEPRAIINDDANSVRVTEAPDQNGLNITISFTVATTLSEATVDVNLNRIR